jgi:hypothetical protein
MSNGPFHTVFGALDNYSKGTIEIIKDDPKHYAFSNVFAVASKSRPYEKVVVALNLGYVLETLRAQGSSDWFTASHDEFAIILDGEVRVDFIKLAEPEKLAPLQRKGSVKVAGEPPGARMGYVLASRGHQVLLAQGVAYRFSATQPGVILLQTLLGELSVQKWTDICYK